LEANENIMTKEEIIKKLKATRSREE